MSPVDMKNGEVQYYASPILVKNQKFYATLTSERLVLEGDAPRREFRVSSIVAAYAVTLEAHEPGLNLVIATPNGHKEMIWSFPTDSRFKEGDRDAWISNFAKVAGDSFNSEIQPYAEAEKPVSSAYDTNPPVRPVMNSNIAPPSYQHGEVEVISTSGVRIKRAYYNLYLTNLRLILQNNDGKIGREFSISDLMDAAELESETGESAIAVSVGSQSGPKQMLLIFPTGNSRDAWMRELRIKLPLRHTLVTVPQSETYAACKVGSFVPQRSEKLISSINNVRIKSNFVIIHLTNTRFVIENPSGIVGEFSISSLLRVMRVAGELGEPGIAVLIGTLNGDKEMHLIFQSMDDRERWIRYFEDTINQMPDDSQMFVPENEQYTVSTVIPHKSVNSNSKYCPSCGARNHIDAEFCSVCSSKLSEPNQITSYDASQRPSRHRKSAASRSSAKPQRSQREPKVKSQYNGSLIGFITRPSDAFDYFSGESPRDAAATFLLSGAIFAFVSVLLLAFLVPVMLPGINAEDFPIIIGLKSNPLNIVLFVLFLFIIWAAAILLRAVITAL
ncbi:MAG TPA: hypothetical protein O0W90_02190, partial [Methanocorpusculum sp.]|nr:hypothetical protein [Methanocorpusculum sp.]